MPFTAPFLLLLLLLLVGPSWAQTFERAIAWPPDSLDLGHGAGPMHFDRAVFPTPSRAVPFYSEVIALPLGVSSWADASVSLGGTVYAPLPPAQAARMREHAEEIEGLQAHFHISPARGRSYLQVSIPALRRNPATGALERLARFEVTLTPHPAPKAKRAYAAPASTSVLSQGAWVKIRVSRTGVHRITHDELVAMGFRDPAGISLWGHNGRQLPHCNSQEVPTDPIQIPLWMELGPDGVFGPNDFILFFAQGPGAWAFDPATQWFAHHLHEHSNHTHYFLTVDRGNPLRIGVMPALTSPPTRTSTTFDALAHFEREDVNLLRSGRLWLGESFSITPTLTFATGLGSPAPGEQSAIEVRTAVRSAAASSFTVRAQGVSLGAIPHTPVSLTSSFGVHASISSRIFRFANADGELGIQITFNSPSPAAMAWLDYVTVNSRQRLHMGQAQLLFRDRQSVSPGAITGFQLSSPPPNLRIWDVTQLHSPMAMPLTLGSGLATFSQHTADLREFVAFTPDMAHPVTVVGPVPNQNIHGEPQPEMVIVAHPLFLPHAAELAALHAAHSNLRSLVVTTEQVYNEFSSGTPDIAAIRNMMRMFHRRAGGDSRQMPRYLLLFGDGSYNNRLHSRENTNFIPTYQSENSTDAGSFVTDDFFGLLDPHETHAQGLLDIGIGRIPASTVEEAAIALTKIRSYLDEATAGSWQSQVLFIGDDVDNNLHMFQSDVLAQRVQAAYPYLNISKVYMDAYPRVTTPEGPRYPAATQAINSLANQGVLIMNYIGHANPQWLSNSKVLRIGDILSWRNLDRLNLFITATCEFSRFDDFSRQSAGEIALFAPRGGSVGLVSTTRVVFASQNFTLLQRYFEVAFARRNDPDIPDTHYRLGDLLRLAKNRVGNDPNKLSFMLLGDPALSLRHPSLGLEVTSINATPVGQPLDTVRALSRMEVRGRVVGPLGDHASGEASILLYDKERSIATLGNVGNQPFNFSSRETLIYRGRSTIANGEFTAQFIIPKDIMLRYGPGRISLFAKVDGRTGAGYFEDFIVGGISDRAINDTQGPGIEVFLNDEHFVPGGITDPNPLLIVQLTDSSGINTTGVGIGHDLTATLLGTPSTQYLLNDFYEAALDSYQRGTVRYQLTNLPEGPQTIRVKAWDVLNNSAEAELQFTVRGHSRLTLARLLNYPNPFTHSTGFFFEHNQPFESLDVLIQIISPSGRLVRTLRHHQPAGGSLRVGPIPWDGLDDFGNRIGRGVYFYRVAVRTATGRTAEAMERLVTLR